MEDIEIALIGNEEKLKISNKEIEDAHMDNERMLEDMEKSFEVTKSNHVDLMNKIKLELESISKEKAETQRLKKSLESKSFELEQSLSGEEQKHLELEKKCIKILKSVDETTEKLRSEQLRKDEGLKDLMTSETKCRTLANCLEEVKRILEQVDRSRRQAEQELADSQEVINDLSFQTNTLAQTNQQLMVQARNLQVLRLRNIF